jgi:hypothetical protein
MIYVLTCCADGVASNDLGNVSVLDVHLFDPTIARGATDEDWKGASETDAAQLLMESYLAELEVRAGVAMTRVRHRMISRECACARRPGLRLRRAFSRMLWSQETVLKR